MLLNSGIERLISSSGSDEDAAAIVIACTKDLPISGKYELNMTRFSRGNTFSGHTDEMGDVPIHTGNETRTKNILGGEAERIGNYRVKKLKEGNVCISHFWGYEETTRMPDEMPEKYLVLYDTETHEYSGLYKVVPIVRTFEFLSFRIGITRETLSELYVVKK
jgi:hypothetical protein